MASGGLSLQRKYPVIGFLFSAFLFILWILPRPLFRALVWFVFNVFYIVVPKMGRHAVESLDLAFGPSMSLQKKKKVARASFFHLAEGLAWVIYGVKHKEFVRRSFTVEGQELLDRALQGGKGAVVAVAHFGPFAWMIQYFALCGYPANVIMRAPRGPFLREKFLEAKERFGLNLIYSVPVRRCVTDCYKALANGEMVFMPIDQNYGSAGRIFVDFFGRKVGTAPGAASYALKTGAPLFFMFCLPEKDGRYKIVIESVPLTGQVDDQAAQVACMARLTARLEALVRQFPDQWSWMHRRWKAVPREGEI